MTAKLTPIARRAQFLEDVFADYAHTDEAARAIAQRLADEGPDLGRAERWRMACAWPLAQIEAGREPQWAVMQGSVWLAHAHD